eukprot:CAMPEP_0113908048 /NCGR_PEP_ID=MMETSP0780_2-20120614/25900_1 /TAXON_ID=652834 /ORGANISM="Palpitomonas bilix" /LENGTH=191 /DNA_ID=CAMNT_0000903343 /DNA_START=92 /DNA_END=667 /DNA_ORIENTATION=+ /assembly_acc=CAM_ASM_000599
MADNKKIAELEAALSAANKRAEEAEKRANAAEEKLGEVEKRAKDLEATLQDELNLRDVEEEETIARVNSSAADVLASRDVELTALDKERMELQILLKNKMDLLEDAEKRATAAETRMEVFKKELEKLKAHQEALREELDHRDVDHSIMIERMRSLDATLLAVVDEEVEAKENYIAQLEAQVSKEKEAKAAE